MKKTLVMDIECYKNYFLVMFKDVESKVVSYFEIYNTDVLNFAAIRMLLQGSRIVTFNGINYDMPMLAYALQGANSAQLKAASDSIIHQNLRSWQFEKKYSVKVSTSIDHIDLIEPVPGVKISLKLYGGRMHSARLQDLPYDPDIAIDETQRLALREYCENDLDTTIDLWNTATSTHNNIIETRELLSAEFGVDLRSKSDAQIAETIIKLEVERISGVPVHRQSVAEGTRYKYTPPDFISFATPKLQSFLDTILMSDFVVDAKGKIKMPSALVKAVATIGSSDYKLGIGGLHSMEKSVSHLATPSARLLDRDVVSYYPSLILQCGLSPKNMGSAFQRVYKNFFDRRLAAKRAGHESASQTLKILLNGTFGKLGSCWSSLYSPDLLIQVTVTGQLAMLMLIEKLELAGVLCVSANTDGVVMLCPTQLEPTMLAVVKQWESTTGLKTEETEYRALLSRDVNNYLALTAKKGSKTKGVLSKAGIAKNPANAIVNDAVIALLVDGVPVAETILKCRDIRKFLRVQQVSGGGTHAGKYLGKVCRWYRGVRATECISYANNGNKVAYSDGAVPMMTLCKNLPGDIDYGFYIREANDLLSEIGAIVPAQQSAW